MEVHLFCNFFIACFRYTNPIFAWVVFVLLSHPISCLIIGPKMTMSRNNGRVTGWHVGISRCPPESIPYLWTNRRWNWFFIFNLPNNMTRLFRDLWLLYGIRKLNCFLLLFHNHLSFPTTKRVNQQTFGCNFLAYLKRIWIFLVIL